MIARSTVFVFLFVFAFSALSSAEAKRVALVIGNANYMHASSLKNPTNDARLMAETLQALNFEVIHEKDLGRKAMSRAVSAFNRKLFDYGQNTVGLIFYAGHAVQVNGQNYLLPVDADIANEGDVPIEALKVNDMLFGMSEAKNRINILILDSCRDNPYQAKFRSAFRGLAPIIAPQGSFIAYATAPGQKAVDGEGDHSPFTAAIALHIKTPGLPIAEVFRLVSKDVKKATENKQRPWRTTDMDEVFYPAGKVQKKLAVVAPPPKSKVGKPAVPAVGLSFEPGSTFRDCEVCPEMVVVPAGSYMMGSPKNEKGRDDDEGPQRKVTIAKPFAVGKFEVTVGEYLACVEADRCRLLEWQEKGNKYNIKTGSDDYYKKLGTALTGGHHPIVGVSWDDAQAYAKWINGKVEGTPYKLLSEAEWEYVARAKSDTPFWWGSSISTDQANYNGNFTYNGPKGVYREKTVSVDSFKLNAFGLYNVHGNVREWTQDCWHKNYKSAPTDGSAWLKDNGGECDFRVLRGGSWINLPQDLRSANRDGHNQDFRGIRDGFRLSRTLE